MKLPGNLMMKILFSSCKQDFLSLDASLSMWKQESVFLHRECGANFARFVCAAVRFILHILEKQNYLKNIFIFRIKAQETLRDPSSASAIFDSIEIIDIAK